MSIDNTLRRLIISEDSLEADYSINDNINWIEIENTSRTPFSFQSLYSKLKNLNNIENIYTLQIRYSSTLKDLRIVEFFPNLRTIFLEGKNLLDLSQLGTIKKLKSLIIDIGNKKRKLDGIEKVDLYFLEITADCKQDLEILSRCEHVSSLWIRKISELETVKLSSLNILDLTLISGKFQSISNTNALRKLEELCLSHCRRLVSFGEGNSILKKLEIEACSKLDLRTTANFEGLNQLTLGTQKITAFDFINELKALKNLKILNSKVLTDDYGPLINSLSLKQVWLSVNKKTIEKIARQNDNLKITNGDVFYKHGKVVSTDEYFDRI